MAQKVTIQFGAAIDTSDLSQITADIKKALTGSSANKAMTDNANKYAKAIIDASAELERLKKKGTLDGTDIKNLDKYTQELEDNILSLKDVMGKVGAAPTQLTQDLSNKLTKYAEDAKQATLILNNTFKKDIAKSYGRQLTPKQAGIEMASLGAMQGKLQGELPGATPERTAEINKELAELAQKLAVLAPALAEYERKLKLIEKAHNRNAKMAKTNAENEQNIADTKVQQNVQNLSGKLSTATGWFGNFKTAVLQTKTAFTQASATQEAFGQTISEVGNRIKQFTSVIFLLRKAIQTVKESAAIVSELDKEMTEIGIVSKQTNKELWDTFDTFNQLARNLSTTTRQYLEGAKIFYQQGYETSEVIAMVDATTKAATLSSVSFKDASEALTAAIRAFNMEASMAASITDKYAAVGAFSAADFHELSVAMEKVASSAYTAGMSFDYTLGVLAKGIETTKEAPEAIGTALKTIIARFQEMKENPMADLGEGVDANRVEKALKTIGVALRDTNGEFRNLDDVFTDLGNKWQGLTRNQKAYIATMAAGSRQQSRFMAIMNNYDRTLELVRMSTNSAGEANRQYAIYVDSVEAAQNRLKNSQEAFSTALTSSVVIKEYYNVLTGTLDILTQLNPAILAVVAVIGLLTGAILRFIVVKQAMTAAELGGAAATTASTLAYKLSHSKILQQIAVTLKLATTQTFQTGTALSAAAATATLTAATIAFVAILALLVIGISVAIRAAEKYRKAIHDNAAQLSKEAQEAKENYVGLKGQVDRYEELTKIIDKTNEEKTEMVEITNQIIEQNPELIDGIDAEGKAYLKNIVIVKDYLKEQQKLMKESQAAAFYAQMESMKVAEWGAPIAEGTPGQLTVQAQENIGARLDKSLAEASGGSMFSNWIAKRVKEGLVKGLKPEEITKTVGTRTNWAQKWGSLLGGYLPDLLIPFSPAATQWAENTFVIDSAEEQRIKELIDQNNKDLINYEKIQIADMQKTISSGLYNIGSLYLDALELEGETVSQEYRSMLARFSSQASKKTLDANFVENFLGLSEGEMAAYNAKPAKDKILDYAEQIQNVWLEQTEKMRKDKSFQSALVEMTKLKTEGASYNEMMDSWKKLMIKFYEGADEATEGMLNDMFGNFFDQEAFDFQLAGIFNHITEEINKYKPNTTTIVTTYDIETHIGTDTLVIDTDFEDQITKTFEGLPTTVKDMLYNTIEGFTADEVDLEQSFLAFIPELFGDSKWVENFTSEFAKAGDNPAAIEALMNNLKNQMSTVGVPQEFIDDLVEKFIPQSTQLSSLFLKQAQNTYKIFNDINNLIRKSLSGALSLDEAMSTIDTYGGDTVSFVGDQVIANQSALMTVAREKEAAAVDSLRGMIIKLKEDQENYLDATIEGNKEEWDAMQAKIDSYNELIKVINKVTITERGRMENQELLEGIDAINSQIDTLSDLGKVFEQIQEGPMDFLDVLDAIGNNPDLVLALEETNNGLQFSKELMLDLAEAKKVETATFLLGEKAKIDAQIAVVKTAITTQEQENAARLASYIGQSNAMYAVSDAQGESTETFINNKQKEINAQWELLKLLKIEAGFYGKDLSIGYKAPSIQASIDEMGSASEAAKKLQEQYGATNLYDLLSKLEGQSLKYASIITKVMSIKPEDMLAKAAGTKKSTESGGNKDDFESFFGEFDRYYNYLKKLEKLESNISAIDSKISLQTTGGAEDIALLEEKALAIANQTQVLESLIKTRKANLKLSQQEGSAKYGGFIDFIDDEIEVRWDLINALEINSEAEKEWYDNMLKFIDTYSSATDAIEENTNSLLENQKAIEEMTQTLIDEAINTRQQLYDALVESDRRELDATKEKYDAMKEAQNDYLQAVKTAIDKERQMRDDSNKEEDLAQKKRKLAVLERDTSGLYTREAESLRGEIRGDEESLRDQSVDRQYEALQKQYELQQEQRDLEIQSLEEQIAFREETGAYWNMVDETIRNGPDAMQALLETSASYTNADPLQQAVMSQNFANQAAKLDALFKAGQEVSVDQSSVVNMIKAGADSVANQVSKIQIPTFDTKPITEAINNLQVKINNSGSTSGSPSGTNTSPSGTNTSSSVLPMKPTAAKTIYENKTVMTKEQVKALQVMLNATLGKSLAIDGSYGPTTKAAFTEWYRKNYPPEGIQSMAYSTGGVVDYTGPAWVHGTKNKPETFLNADQTKLFAHLRDMLEREESSLMSDGFGSNSSNTINIGDIILQLQNPTNASSREIARLVQKEILNTFQNRLTTSIPKSR